MKPFPSLIFFLVIAVLIFVILGVFLVSRSSQPNPPTAVSDKNTTIVPTEVVRQASLQLKTVLEGPLKLGNNINIAVTADSDTQPVTGFDAVVLYDRQKVTYLKTLPVVDGYKIYTTDDKKGKLYITGIKNAVGTVSLVFTNTPVAEITFQSIAKGQAGFSLEFESGSTKDSNLITDKNVDILGSVTGVTVNIE